MTSRVGHVRRIAGLRFERGPLEHDVAGVTCEKKESIADMQIWVVTGPQGLRLRLGHYQWQNGEVDLQVIG